MERNGTVDWLKAVGSFGVVVIHAAAPGMREAVGSAAWFGAVFWGVLFRAAVPVFFLCSGALLLDPQRPLPYSRLFTRYILRISLIIAVFGMIYRLTGVAGHLYFLQIMLLFYLCVPILRVFAAHGGRRELGYTLGVWFLVGILWPTVRQFWPVGGIPGQWALPMAYAALGYGLLGHCLRTYGLSRRTGLFLFLTGFLFTLAATCLLSLRRGELVTVFLEGMSPGPAIMAVGAWGLSFFIERPPKWVKTASKASLFVLLTHVFLLKWLHFGPIFPRSTIIWATCAGLYALLHKIAGAAKGSTRKQSVKKL